MSDEAIAVVLLINTIIGIAIFCDPFGWFGFGWCK